MKEYDYKEEKIELEDVEFLLITAIDNLTNAIEHTRRSLM